MVNISKMAKAAGIGSAVGATIGGIKEAQDKNGDVLGGIVGGAFVGSIGGAGISAGRQYLQAKKLANASGSSIADIVTKNTPTTQVSTPQQPVTQPSVIKNTQDLDVAKQVSRATAGNTSPIQVNSAQSRTIEELVDDYYGPGTSADIGKDLSDFKETKTFRKWFIPDP